MCLLIVIRIDMAKRKKTNESTPYDRELKFIENFNSIISTIVDAKMVDKCYYHSINPELIIKLKKDLSVVNNIITYRTTIAFVELLCTLKFINQQEKNNLIGEINKTPENANGFDIKKDGGSFKFIAEVKGNIPKGQKFESGQINGIYTDIIHLNNGKGNINNIGEYHKFMVFMRCNNIDQAINSLMKNTPKADSYNMKSHNLKQNDINKIWGNIELLNGDSLNCEKTYICVIDI